MHKKKKKKRKEEKKKKEKKKSDCEREKKRYSAAGTGNTYKCIGERNMLPLGAARCLSGKIIFHAHAFEHEEEATRCYRIPITFADVRGGTHYTRDMSI